MEALVRVAFSTSEFTISATITDEGKVEDLIIEDEDENSVSPDWDSLQRLLQHVNMEQQHAQFSRQQQLGSFGPLMGRQVGPAQASITGEIDDD
jgi:hypothetical protein